MVKGIKKEIKSGKSEKRGEITSTQIVTVILLIAGFVVVLYFITLFNPSEEIDRTACHQSVIFRGTLPVFGDAKDFIPLNCKTEKICISTKGSGECEDFSGVVEAEEVKTVKVSKAEDVSKAISDDVVDCWSTLGQGKVSLFSNFLAQSYGVGTIYPTCVVCSRVAFDKKALDEKGIKISDVNLDDYMRKNKVPGKELSYYEYLSDAPAKLDVSELTSDQISPEEQSEADKYLESLKINPDEIKNELVIDDYETPDSEDSTKELAIVFTQITSPTHTGVFQTTMASALGVFGLGFKYAPGAFIGNKVVGVGKFTKLALTPFSKVVIVAGVITGVAQQTNVARNKYIAAGYCGDVTTGSEGKEGCSIVRVVAYDPDEISSYCSVIESIP